MDLREQIGILHQYSACDVSDALLKLQKPASGEPARAGYLADIIPFAPKSPFTGTIDEQPKIIAPASTVKMVEKSSDLPILSSSDPGAIPQGSQWVDMVEAGTVVAIEQPSGQTCAAVGGIMAARMKVRGVQACLVGGRVRDLAELKESGLPIWAAARSTVGVIAEAKAYARNVPISINSVNITAGDIIFCDPVEGVVVIPHALLDDVVNLIPRLAEADERVKEDVEKGVSVAEAFKRHRG